MPIWGEENLNRHIRSDSVKAGLLMNRGYVVIRIKNLIKNLSAKNMRDVFEKLTVELKKIEQEFPPMDKRLVEIET